MFFEILEAFYHYGHIDNNKKYTRIQYPFLTCENSCYENLNSTHSLYQQDSGSESLIKITCYRISNPETN